MRYGISLLLLAAVSMAQPALFDTPGPGAGRIETEHSDGQNISSQPLSAPIPGQPTSAPIKKLPPEMLEEVLNNLDPMDLKSVLPTSRWLYHVTSGVLERQRK
ncbi:hypothetical protein H4R34_005768, partial [Dimargaris verticillata]